MPHATLQVIPLENKPFGARIILPDGVTDPSKLSDSDFDLLNKALHTHLVLLLPDQQGLTPESQFELTKRFDPTCAGGYGHGKTFRNENSILKKDGASVPRQPQVQILGQGYNEEHEGLTNFTLTHPTHLGFHRDLLTQEEMDAGKTRFYRWHIDSALYDLSPPMCTTLLGLHCPETTKRQTVVYGDDSNDSLETSQAATAFVSGANSFDILSDEDKELALNTIVEYAPHPYIYISKAKATSDGLTMHSEGKEASLDELPEWEESKIKKLPMVWTDPITGRHHLQVHGCCAAKLHRASGKTLGLEETRKELHRIMRPAIAPEHVYAHDWKAGDLVMFYNQGLWHSVTGQFAEGESRLMHQCNIASGFDPKTVV